MSLRRRITAIVTGFAILSSSVAVSAQSAADRDTARLAFKDGKALREKADHKGALAKFKSADALMHSPITLVEVGKSQIDLGQLVEARDTLLAVNRLPLAKDENDQSAKARADARDLAARLEKRIPSLTFKVVGVDTAGVTVTIDGEAVPKGTLELPRKVNPGKHAIAATYQTSEKKQAVEVAEGARKVVTFEFTPTAATLPAKEPATGKDPAPPAAGDAAAPTSATRDTIRTRRSAPTADSNVMWVGIGVAGAGVVVGSVSGIVYLSKASSLREQCPNGVCPASLSGDYDSTKNWGTVSLVSFVVAGVGAGIGIYGLFSSSPSEEVDGSHARAKPSVQPWIGLGSAGLSGTF